MVENERSIGSYTTSTISAVGYTIGSSSTLSKCVNFAVLDTLFSDIHYALQFNIKSNYTDACTIACTIS